MSMKIDILTDEKDRSGNRLIVAKGPTAQWTMEQVGDDDPVFPSRPLAQSLGYGRDRKLSELTKRLWATATEYRPAMGRYEPSDGEVVYRLIPNPRGEATKEYLYTRRQVLKLIMRSETPRADEMQDEIVEILLRLRHTSQPQNRSPLTIEALARAMEVVNDAIKVEGARAEAAAVAVAMTVIEPLKAEIERASDVVRYVASQVEEVEALVAREKAELRKVIRRASTAAKCDAHSISSNGDSNVLAMIRAEFSEQLELRDRAQDLQNRKHDEFIRKLSNAFKGLGASVRVPKNVNTVDRVCKCGCGEILPLGSRKNKVFLTGYHRLRYFKNLRDKGIETQKAQRENRNAQMEQILVDAGLTVP